MHTIDLEAQQVLVGDDAQHPKVMHYVYRDRYEEAVLDAGTVRALCGRQWRPSITNAMGPSARQTGDAAICPACAKHYAVLFGGRK
ncbi:DUF3039 domain-containing protein [Kocuria sp. cx-455]|uniref:DUF3039 domain-containing protein n=1 Tax=Kocuria sp. cx-455 TaxID=2771377 RepID=UPI003D716773